MTAAICITVLLYFLFDIPFTRAQGQGTFVNPGPQINTGNYSVGLNFEYGASQTFTWTVNLPSVRLSLWQQILITNYQGDAEDILSYNVTSESFVWNGVPVQNLSQGNVFFLEMYDAAQAVGFSNPIATSEYFNVSQATVSAVTTTSTSSTQSHAATRSQTTTSSPTITLPPHQSRSSSALAIGLGAGLGGLAFVLLSTLGVICLGRLSAKRRSEEHPSATAKLPHVDEHYRDAMVQPPEPRKLQGEDIGVRTPYEIWSAPVTLELP